MNKKTIINKKIILILISFVIIVFTVNIVTRSVNAAESPDILVGQDMTLGSTGHSVEILQGLLSELGYLKVPIGIPFGYYGPLTRSAVAEYQRSQNVSPAVGYYGPITKIAMRNHFALHNWLPLLGW